MKKLNTKGFTIVEGLLILLIVGVIGGVGFYVWHRQSENKKLAAITSFTECKADKGSAIQESYPEVCVTKNGKHYTNPDQKLDFPSAESADWLAYQPSDKRYKIKLADGWKVYYVDYNGDLWTHADLAIKAGTKATVSKVNSAYDFATGLSTFISSDEPTLHSGEKLVNGFKTNEGKTVTKYYFVQTQEPNADDDSGYLQKGEKAYNYLVNGSKDNFGVLYVVGNNETDYHENVERVIKTLQLP